MTTDVLATLPPRFVAKIKVSDTGCYLWTSATSRGYGTFWDGKQITYAHRYVYALVNGLIPEGLAIDHLCRVPLCVNPAHLEAVTQAENNRRASTIGYSHPSAPTTCRRGHDWTETPPYEVRRSDGTTTRRCRTCHLEKQRAAWAAGHRSPSSSRRRVRTKA